MQLPTVFPTNAFCRATPSTPSPPNTFSTVLDLYLKIADTMMLTQMSLVEINSVLGTLQLFLCSA